jgi:hypothetical protein
VGLGGCADCVIRRWGPASTRPSITGCSKIRGFSAGSQTCPLPLRVLVTGCKVKAVQERFAAYSSERTAALGTQVVLRDAGRGHLLVRPGAVSATGTAKDP